MNIDLLKKMQEEKVTKIEKVITKEFYDEGLEDFALILELIMQTEFFVFFFNVVQRESEIITWFEIGVFEKKTLNSYHDLTSVFVDIPHDDRSIKKLNIMEMLVDKNKKACVGIEIIFRNFRFSIITGEKKAKMETIINPGMDEMFIIFQNDINEWVTKNNLQKTNVF